MDQSLKLGACAAGRWESDDREIRPVGRARGEPFGGALLAAGFLIGPISALVLRQEVCLQLKVVTGCNFAFGAVMLLALETLEAVFAAVLMVFVGVLMARLGDVQ